MLLDNTRAECRNRLCGMTRAPRRAMASAVALDPLSLGMNSPLSTSLAGGFPMLISTKKHAAITNTRRATKNSSFCTPYLCSPRRRSVLAPAMRTPIHTGMLNRRLKANAVPITSGMSAAMTATSASNQRQILTHTGYSDLHRSARCRPVTTPRLAESDCIISAKTSPIRITQRSSYLWFAPACRSVSKFPGSR